MTVWWAALLTGVAAWIAVSVPRRVTKARRAGPAKPRSVVLLIVGSLLLLALAPVAGPWALCAPMLVGTAGWLVRKRRIERRARRRRLDLAHSCRDLAGELKLGRVPSSALANIGVRGPLASAASLQAVGGDVVALWRRESLQPGEEAKFLLACAWEVSVRSGSPLGPLLDLVSREARRREEQSRQTQAELAGPQATATLLALLPVVGCGLGYAMGADPWHFLNSTLVGSICLVVACALTCGGLVWSERMAQTTAGVP